MSQPARSFALVTLMSVLFSFSLNAQTNGYSLDWWTIAGGGGAITGGVYTLSATIGQPLGGNLGGTNYTLETGFWAIAVQTPGAPRLQVSRTPDGVILSWDKSSGGFVLDQQFVLGDPFAGWTVVDLAYQTNATSIYVTFPPRNGKQFFRLWKS